MPPHLQAGQPALQLFYFACALCVLGEGQDSGRQAVGLTLKATGSTGRTFRMGLTHNQSRVTALEHVYETETWYLCGNT